MEKANMVVIVEYEVRDKDGKLKSSGSIDTTKKEFDRECVTNKDIEITKRG